MTNCPVWRTAILPPVRFELRHDFSSPAPEVAAALLDPSFQASLDGLGPLKSREVLSQETEAGGRVTRRVRCVLGIDLGAASRFLGDSEPAWVEEARWDPKQMSWSWVIHPEVAEHLLSASGTMALQDRDEGASRLIDGRVDVRVPLYGGKVEGWIVKGISDAYEEEAGRLETYLAGR